VDSDVHDENTYSEEPDDDVLLASLVHRSSSSSKIHSIPKTVDRLCDMDEGTEDVISKSCRNQSGRKRVHMVILDDEFDESPEIAQSKRILTSQTDSLSTSGTCHMNIV
jgi:TATA-binding protein-associated factor Taf7